MKADNKITILGNDWIDMDDDCLTQWNCGLDVYEMLGIREWREEGNEPGGFVADIFGWATLFIGVVVTVTLIVSGLIFVFSWWDEKLADKWKSWIKYSIIWLLLVSFSYIIIQALIQIT